MWYKIMSVFTLLFLLLDSIPILFLFLRKKRAPFIFEINLITPYLWFLFIGGIYEVVFTIILYVNNAYWFTFYTVAEFLILNYFFYRLLNNRKILYKIFTLLFLITTGMVLPFWTPDSHLKMESYLTTIGFIFLLIWTIIWFRSVFKQNLISLSQNPAFYFVCGNMIYLSGTVILFLVIDFLYKTTELITKYWLILYVLGVFMRIMMAIGVWKATEKK